MISVTLHRVLSEPHCNITGAIHCCHFSGDQFDDDIYWR